LFSLPPAGALFGGLAFGVVGMGVFAYGKKQARFMPMGIGAALMVYPYFITSTWLIWAVGVGLCVALYVLRDRY